MSEKYLAVHDDGVVYIEDSAAAVARSIAHNLPIQYHLIELDGDTNAPSLRGPVTLSNAPRTTVRRVERVSLDVPGGNNIGSAEVEVDQ